MLRTNFRTEEDVKELKARLVGLPRIGHEDYDEKKHNRVLDLLYEAQADVFFQRYFLGAFPGTTLVVAPSVRSPSTYPWYSPFGEGVLMGEVSVPGEGKAVLHYLLLESGYENWLYSRRVYGELEKIPLIFQDKTVDIRYRVYAYKALLEGIGG